MNLLQVHEEAIRSQVCADCIYPTGLGVCGAGNTMDCPLNTLLPKAVAAVKSGRSDSLMEYFQGLLGKKGRDAVLSSGDAQWLRNSMPLIAAAVEEADHRVSSFGPSSKKRGVRRSKESR